jgi:hypothetical protein
VRQRPGMMAMLAAAGALAASMPAAAAQQMSKVADLLPGSQDAPRHGDSLAYLRTPGPGHTVAHLKRLARKKRNRLRAKGQFRKAVR